MKNKSTTMDTPCTDVEKVKPKRKPDEDRLPDGWVPKTEAIPLTVECADRETRSAMFAAVEEIFKPYACMSEDYIHERLILEWRAKDTDVDPDTGQHVNIDRHMYGFMRKRYPGYPPTALADLNKYFDSVCKRTIRDGTRIPTFINAMYPIRHNGTKRKKDKTGKSVPVLDVNGNAEVANSMIRWWKLGDDIDYRLRDGQFVFRITGFKIHDKKTDTDIPVNFTSVISGRNNRTYEVMEGLKNGTLALTNSRLRRVKIRHGTNSAQKRDRSGNTGYRLILDLVYKHPPAEHGLDPDKAMGVDIGVNLPMVCANNFNNRIRILGDSDYVCNTRRMFDRTKRHFQRIGRRDGHEKESRWSENYYHTLSKQAIELCVEWGCGMLKIEDLSGITGYHSDINERILWVPSKLISMLKYKAEAQGIKVLFVNPRNTSNRCSECGYTHWMNRMRGGNRSEFICRKCGAKKNSDKNSAVNIACVPVGKDGDGAPVSLLPDGYPADPEIPDAEIAQPWFYADGHRKSYDKPIPYRIGMKLNDELERKWDNEDKKLKKEKKRT